MPPYKDRIHYLLEVYISGQASAEEENELMDRVLEAGENPELRSFILGIWNQYHPVLDRSGIDWDEVYDRVIQSRGIEETPKLRRLAWGRLAAAAVVAIVLAAGSFFLFSSREQQPVKSVATDLVHHDIAPPSDNRAVLTLADGTEIKIDSAGNGTLAMQGDIRITKSPKGEISYTGTRKAIGNNILTVPRGSWPMSLVLSDGSKVWLNTGSTLTYPVAFFGGERNVKITGEAYFEVAHQNGKPFIVEHNGTKVEVLGTHFNVNTYEDEGAERVTLLEGSVRVSKDSDTRVLKPGQQANVSNSQADMKILNDVDMEEVIAWRDNKFKFGESATIGTIMRQISRWYDVEIEYKGIVNQRFWGSISKNVNVSQVLQILEAAGGVKFMVEGKKIVVVPVAP